MAFPVLTSVATTDTGTSDTSQTVNLPGSLASGDIVIIIGGFNGTTGTVVYPAGWNVIQLNSSTPSLSVAYRRCDGSEGATINVTWSVNRQNRWKAHRYTSVHASSNPEAGTSVGGTSTTPDAPSLTASWGAAMNLFLVIAIHQASTVSAYPSGYVDNQADMGNLNGSISYATKNSFSATDDPGTYTLAASVAWIAETVVIRGTPPVTSQGHIYG